MIGDRVGPYTICEQLGGGGMGVVYRAEDPRLGRSVAIKFLPATMGDNPASLERFQREARAASVLDHPGICHIYDVGEHRGQPFIVMEYMDGQTLKERLEAGPLAAHEVLELGAQLAEALQAAHSEGIIHRDIKPANIFVTRHGHARILDFGLVKLAEPSASSPDDPTLTPDSDLTNPGTALGTVAYMSPEQALGEPVDAASDLFSLGVVLYEMATGRRPFEGPTTAAITDQILHHDPEPPSSINPQLPRQLDAAIAGLLVKDSSRRRVSANELVGQLRLLAAGSNPALSVPGPHRSQSRRALLRFLTVTAASAAVVALTLAIGGFWEEGGDTGPGAVSQTSALVILMDSAHPKRIYDPETAARSATNADVLSDVLSDLPIRRQKETIGPDWHRDEDIVGFAPDLVVVHYSGFRQEDSSGPRTRLRLLIRFLAELPTEFLIYSRQPESRLRASMDTLLADLYSAHPDLQSRVHVFGLTDYGPPGWLNPGTSGNLKLRVKEILELE